MVENYLKAYLACINLSPRPFPGPLKVKQNPDAPFSRVVYVIHVTKTFTK
jgi:hypothetical protein